MKRLKYLFLETVWFLPVILGQWLIGPGIVRSRWKAVPLVALPIAAYLTATDKVALRDGTWMINEETSTGLKIGGVPIEEAFFFLLTSWVSAQGVILLIDERSHNMLAGFRTQLQFRRDQKDMQHP
ncbi:MAG TPA: lycopene cyclase domain-containing protein [Anaerolineae bacterium]|jgi:lycopene cyclase domain-containing protein